ncbi:MAG: S1C family serine protease [Opitutae bacterium]
MRSSFKVLLVASLLPHILLPKDETTERAWNRIVPENSDDLLEIQARLQSLLPEVQGAVVSIEAQDGAGSGVIISKDGLVLTAAHVIGSSKKKMTVRLPNGERLPAISLGGSELSDAGMLKITKSGSWPFAKMAPGGSVSLGDWCFGLGHPGGFDQERGIVVRIGRVIGNKNETMQTDSRLLGGDSGGPLFDFDGRVIAIHSRISKKPDENFHVPIESFLANWEFFQNSKLFTLAQMEKGGFLGVACKETEKGVVVVEAIEGTVAEKSGLRPNDLILAVDGENIDNREELTILLATKNPSDEIQLEYEREGSAQSLKIKLGERPEE